MLSKSLSSLKPQRHTTIIGPSIPHRKGWTIHTQCLRSQESKPVPPIPMETPVHQRNTSQLPGSPLTAYPDEAGMVRFGGTDGGNCSVEFGVGDIQDLVSTCNFGVLIQIDRKGRRWWCDEEEWPCRGAGWWWGEPLEWWNARHW